MYTGRNRYSANCKQLFSVLLAVLILWSVSSQSRALSDTTTKMMITKIDGSTGLPIRSSISYTNAGYVYTVFFGDVNGVISSTVAEQIVVRNPFTYKQMLKDYRILTSNLTGNEFSDARARWLEQIKPGKSDYFEYITSIFLSSKYERTYVIEYCPEIYPEYIEAEIQLGYCVFLN